MGNSAKLRATALVEAFNLRAAIELELGNPAGAAAALSDMPPRQVGELDHGLAGMPDGSILM